MSGSESEFSEPIEGTGLDDDRQHAEDPAEGADVTEKERAEVPRVHPEDPAEG